MNKQKIKNKTSVASVIIVIFLAIYLVLLIYPYLWGFTTSFKDWKDFRYNLLGLPKEWHWDNYLKVFSEFKYDYINEAENVRVRFMLGDMFLNSVGYSFLTALSGTVTVYLVAYAVNSYRFKFLKVVDAIVLVTITLPLVGNLPSSIQMNKALGLYNNFVGFSIVGSIAFCNMYYFIMGAQIRSIPRAFREAAEIDGASEFQILFRVMAPLTFSVFLTVFLLKFIAAWNEYQTPYIFLKNRPTVAFGLWYFQNLTTAGAKNTTLKLAACFTVALPIILIFIIFNKKLMQGISLSEGVKE